MKFNIRRGTNSEGKAIAETLAEVFYKDFQSFCDSKETIVSLLHPVIHPERFFVALAENQVVGIAGIADISGYPISVPKKELKKTFGFIKGRIAAKLLAVEFNRPPSFELGQAHIDFVGVRESYRGQGIAKSMFLKIFEEGKYSIFTLDVVSGNERVIGLYEGLGFEIIGKESSNHSRRPGVEFRYLMKKER
ncbi:MAG: N-acetyltransferase [Gallicola sp.]|nr:N-acetyltransferase [Gallicola sp.]